MIRAILLSAVTGGVLVAGNASAQNTISASTYMRLRSETQEAAAGRSSVAPVIATAFLGASLLGGIGYAIGDSEVGTESALGAVLGSAAGGIVGARFGNRQSAPLHTSLGALAGTPLFLLSAAENEGEILLYIAGTIASIGGAVVGNSVGQR